MNVYPWFSGTFPGRRTQWPWIARPRSRGSGAGSCHNCSAAPSNLFWKKLVDLMTHAPLSPIQFSNDLTPIDRKSRIEAKCATFVLMTDSTFILSSPKTYYNKTHWLISSVLVSWFGPTHKGSDGRLHVDYGILELRLFSSNKLWKGKKPNKKQRTDTFMLRAVFAPHYHSILNLAVNY